MRCARCYQKECLLFISKNVTFPFHTTTMKRIAICFVLICTFSRCDTVQQVLNTVPTTSSGILTNQQITDGLKEALTIGTQNSSSKLSAVDGFFADAAVKILLPPEAQNVEKILKSVGMSSLLDNAILSLNRAAEDAAKSASPIFIDAVKQMTIADALGILKGGDFAATTYFKDKTTPALISAFSPVINNSLKKVNATKYWNDVFSVYNKFAAKPVTTDLGAYVTGKAIDGIFYEIGLEEQKIRKDPVARVTDILKTVFGSPLAHGN